MSNGDLYFLLHEFGVKIILFKLQKNCLEAKKDIVVRVYKSIT